MSTREPKVNAAVQLFNYLANLQELKISSVRDIAAYRKRGRVTWVHQIPQHPAVQLSQQFGPDAPFLVVDRVSSSPAPTPPEELQPHFEQDWNDFNTEPALTDEAPPELLQKFVDWLSDWTSWADAEKNNRQAIEIYDTVFQTRKDYQNQRETFELLFGFGLISWQPASGDRVQRHVFTVPVEIERDAQTGQLVVLLADTATTISHDLSMLDAHTYDAELPKELNRATADIGGIHIDGDVSRQFGQIVANLVSREGQYRDVVSVPEPSPIPEVTYTPAFIMRERSQHGAVNAFKKIAEQIAEAGDVPSGLLPLVEANHEPIARSSTAPGAIIGVDDTEEIFSPLPLNERQETVLREVDRKAQTVVQGPPGTGKTHTAAALITHLLAQGNRILVTAQTERALLEVRGKMPKEIQDLAVSFIGSSRDAVAELKGSISRLEANASEFDPAQSRAAEEKQLRRATRLRDERALASKRLLDAYHHESEKHEVGGYRGTTTELIQAHEGDRGRYSWLLEFSDGAKRTKSPLLDQEALELLGLLRDPTLAAASAKLGANGDLSVDIPTAEEFTASVETINRLKSARPDDPTGAIAAYATRITSLSPDTARTLSEKIRDQQFEVERFQLKGSAWQNSLLRDLQHTDTGIYEKALKRLEDHLALLHDELREQTDSLLPPSVEYAGDPSRFEAQARALIGVLSDGKQVTIRPDGSPKMGLFTPKPVKEASEFFTSVTVNGQAPTTRELVLQFLSFLKINAKFVRGTEFVSMITPEGEEAPKIRSLPDFERVVSQVRDLVKVGVALNAVDHELHQAKIPPVSWMDQEKATAYVEALTDVVTQREIEAVEAQLDASSELINDKLAEVSDAPSWLIATLRAIDDRDTSEYGKALAERDELSPYLQKLSLLRTSLAKLQKWNPRLTEALEATANDDAWNERLSSLQEAADWIMLGHRDFLDSKRPSVSSVQNEIKDIDRQLHGVASELAAIRAWREAVDRLDGNARQDLSAYLQLVRKRGAGTGKHAAEQSAAIRRALDRCRPAVPVWIMTLPQVIDQVNLQDNSFDVIIVDEASQLGMEGILLQYLAPRIVVIGDDKQVSPSGIGPKSEEIYGLAAQYLSDVPKNDVFVDHNRSFFDDAVMRFSGKMTLTEHRRCVPEIIEFSNRIAYEPEGIRLEPVRQVGADRLDPFKMVYVPHGNRTGTTDSAINKAEANALIDLLVSCLDDPAYDGNTFGIISLTGQGQAKLLTRLMHERIDPDTIEERELMAGIAPDFQGAERNVMFLSMVVDVSPDKRSRALTTDQYVQRFNVAVSRAKDQVWVVHSMRRSDLANPNDLRHKLLDHGYHMAARTTGELEQSLPVSDTVRTDPFDSLFEQRVYNHLVRKGYVVEPQVKQLGYSLDLVVHGRNGKVAIECDGDYWHGGGNEGPSKIQDDLVRQRNLENAGWRFFRIWESQFYADREHVLAQLAAFLDGKGIEPFSADHSDEPSGNFYRVNPDGSIDQMSDAADTGAADIEVLTQVVEPGSRSAIRAELPATDAGDAQRPFDHQIHEREDDDSLPGSAHDAVAPSGNRPSYAGAEVTADIASPYTKYEAPLPNINLSSAKDIRDNIVRIVADEGPILGDLVATRYARAAKNQRRQAVNDLMKKGLQSAVQAGLIIEEDVTSPRLDRFKRTYRMKDQPSILIRSGGGRKLEEIPPSELLAAARQVTDPNEDDETIMRSILPVFGFKNLSSGNRAALEPIVEQLRD